MAQSQEINELAAALAQAQANMKNPSKGKIAKIRSDKGTFEYKYPDLADGLDSIRVALSAHEIAFIQLVDTNSRDLIVLRTRLIHSSGQWIEGEMPVTRIGTPPQQVGSALTYARRQAIFAMVGICGEDEDDDGAGANSNGSQLTKKDPLDERISQEEAENLLRKINEAGASVQKFTKYFIINNLRELRREDLPTAMKMLDAAQAARKGKNDAA